MNAKESLKSVEIPQNNVLELTFTAKEEVNTPQKIKLIVQVVRSNGIQVDVPGFWAGKNTWRARFASPDVGSYEYTTSCTSTSESDEISSLQDQTGSFKVKPYTGSNKLYKHGRLRAGQGSKHLKHVDGTPFFWLGDTWWMGFTNRLHWPDEFALLTKDRVDKGFTLIQIIAGLYPDMPPFDTRGANEAGFPWDKDFKEINPAYFDMVDRRVQHLVEAGLVPCIVGFWGYFISVAGVEALKEHWRYLVARYGAYPVVWCIAGEAMMPYYLDRHDRKTWKKEERPRRLAAWSEVTAHVKSIDSFHNPVTIHPTRYGHEQLDNPGLLDIDMLQTGHANAAREISTIKNTVKMIRTSTKQDIPVVVGEVCYEGILEANRQEVQRCLFWANILSGGAGHTYGANGIWQLNRRDQPFGPSPHGASWGETPWEDAYQLLGSEHVGAGKKILCEFPWWELEPHPEWVKGRNVYAAGIPGELRIIYHYLPGNITIKGIEKDVEYKATWIDPKDGTRYPIGIVQQDGQGKWTTPKPNIFQDWIMVLKRRKEG
ncbi:MAG: DUF4038 domain-containing protein [Candidatus Hodarchaeota archaeon]